MAADGSVVIDITADDSDAESKLSKLGSVAGAALKGLGVAAAAAGAAVVALGKQAVTAYADYEQLVGGVETLFKSSAPVVEEYAANAFKTAGLSANDYMETVTSFSASLLQSLGGDTEAAAKSADTAITDMADNANKMGTSMEAIQYAYQGFAKQNYTMLDNLKLGYGGTKEEMARLLSDAEKLSGQKYDISNLNDVYAAIHVVQTELGITGTTAKEASTTIQGSAASMKAAWENLLVGMADDTQDFDTLLENFIDSIGTFAENLLPRIQIALGGIAKLAAALGPQIATMLPGLMSDLLPQIATIAVSIVQSLLDGLTSNLPLLATSAVAIITTLVNGILVLLPQLAVTAVQLITALVNGVAAALPTLIPAAVQAVTTLVQGLIDNIPALIDAALQLILGLVDGIIAAIPVLLEALPQIITSLVNGLLAAIPDIINAGIQLLTALVTALPEIITTIVAVLPQIIDGIITALLANLPLIVQAGIDLLVALIQAMPTIITTIVTALPQIITSIINALVSNIPAIIEAGVQLFVALIQNLPTIIVEIVKAVPQIIAGIVSGFASLAGEIVNIGTNIVSGIWEGISNSASWLADQVTGFFSGIVDGVKDFLGIHSPSKVFSEIGGYSIEGFADGVDTSASENEGRILSTVSGLSSDMTDALGNGGGDAGTQLMNKLTTSASSALTNVGTVANSSVSTFTNTVINALPKVQTAAEAVMATLCNAVTAKQPDVVNVATVTVTSMCDTILSKHSEFYSVGVDAMNGFNEGLELQGRVAIATAQSIAAQIISTMQAALDIHSPSRKMRDLVGVPTAQGFFVGFEEEMGGLSKKMQAAVDAETNKISFSAATQAESSAATSGVTREVYKSTNTVEKVAQIEGDGVTGELVRMLGLRLKTEDNRVGDSFED